MPHFLPDQYDGAGMTVDAGARGAALAGIRQGRVKIRGRIIVVGITAGGR